MPVVFAACEHLVAVTPLVVEHELEGMKASGVAGYGLNCPNSCGIFPDQGSNLGPQHWQAESLPLDHPGVLQNIHLFKINSLLQTPRKRMTTSTAFFFFYVLFLWPL